MSATLGVSAFNTKIYVYITDTWTILEEPKDITGPGANLEFIDFTHQQSPSGFRERKPSFKDPGTVTTRCNFVHNAVVQQYLIAAAIANPPTKELFYVIGPDNSRFDFGGYVSFQMLYPINGPEEIQFTFQVDGNITAVLPSASASASASAS